MVKCVHEQKLYMHTIFFLRIGRLQEPTQRKSVFHSQWKSLMCSQMHTFLQGCRRSLERARHFLFQLSQASTLFLTEKLCSSYIIPMSMNVLFQFLIKTEYIFLFFKLLKMLFSFFCPWVVQFGKWLNLVFYFYFKNFEHAEYALFL